MAHAANNNYPGRLPSLCVRSRCTEPTQPTGERLSSTQYEFRRGERQFGLRFGVGHIAIRGLALLGVEEWCPVGCIFQECASAQWVLGGVGIMDQPE